MCNLAHLPSVNSTLNPTEPAGYRLSLLGEFCLRRGPHVIDVPPSGRRLLAYLALHPASVDRRRLAHALWTDSSEEHAVTSLRSVLWRLRQRASTVVDAGHDRVTLSRDVRVDLHETVALSRTMIEQGGPVTDEPVAAASLTGELLPGWSDEWVLVERERARQLQMHALEVLCRSLTRRGDHIAAIEAGLAAVATEPLRETAHRVLIEAHLAEGNRSEAVRQFSQFTGLLRDELDVEPSSDLRRLLE